MQKLPNYKTGHVSATFKTQPRETGGYIRIDVNGGEHPKEAALYFVECELSEGSTAPIYSQAVEDTMDYTDSKVTNLQLTINGIQATVANKAERSQVTQLSNQITSIVSGQSNPNLIANSMDPTDVAKLGWLDTKNLTIVTHPAYNKGGTTLFLVKAYDKTEKTVTMNLIEVSRNTVYTFSIKALASVNVSSMDVFILRKKRGQPTLYSDPLQLFNAVVPDPGKMSSFKTTFNIGDYDEAVVRVDNNGSTNNKKSWLLFAELKLEVGTQATPDIQTNEASQITQLKDDINLRVTKGDVINQINISPEGILIAGKKVHITGQTTIGNAVISDAMIASIKADKITAGTLNAANINVINLNAASITTGTPRGANLSLNLTLAKLISKKATSTRTTVVSILILMREHCLLSATQNLAYGLKKGP